ncbi:MAG: MFS transporter [Syntrophobacteraceae bacterium]
MQGFSQVFFGRMISAVGDKFFTLAVAWWIISQGDKQSKIHLSLLMAANILPMVLFGPAMGAIADRLSRKRCMIAANLFRALLLSILFLLFFRGGLTLPRLYILCFSISCFVPLFESSAQSSIEALTDPQSVPRAVALNSMTVYLSNILGAMLGGIALAVIGVGWAMAFDASCYLASTIFIATLSLHSSPAQNREGFNAQIKAGFRYLANAKDILSLLILFGCINLFAAPLMLLIPMIVRFVIHENASWLGIFEASFAFGAALTAGVLSFRKVFSSIYPIMFGCLTLMGLATGLIAFTPVKYLMAPEFFLIGLGLACTSALSMSLFQNHVPEDMKGRFFSILITVCFSVIPFAYLLTGFLSDLMTIRHVLMLNGTAIMLMAPILLVVPRISDAME